MTPKTMRVISAACAATAALNAAIVAKTHPLEAILWVVISTIWMASFLAWSWRVDKDNDEEKK